MCARRLPVLLAAALIGCGGGDPAPETPEPPQLHTPRWAFEPWISKDISDRADTEAFVSGFEARDIPVGVLVLDSPWDTNYTEFRPNPSRYPGFGEMVSDLRGRGVRTVLWVTQMTNEESFDLESGGDTYLTPALSFLEARRRGFLVNEGETFFWWKGKGGAIDFFDPEAVEWWHGLQDELLDLGVAGWKLDFGDSYVNVDTVRTDAGEVPHQAYSEAYYRDYWEHGASRLGTDEFVTMVRGYDKSYNFEGRFFARPEHAPVIWAGDNRRDWVGLADALDHMLRSAAAGYQVVGSDIGGYLDRDDQHITQLVPADVVVFNRWTAIGALTPFMQLHGRANLTPWTVEERAEETEANYRYWSWLHHAMIPLFYSLTEAAYAGGAGVLRPLGDEADWPDDYRFMIGDALLVAPILDATGVRDVPLPGGARWYDWWAPEAEPLDGGQVLMDVETATIGRVPLYVKSGAIIPLDVERDVIGVGRAAAAGHRTLLVYPDEAPSRFTIHEQAGPMVVEAAREGSGARVAWDTSELPVLLRVRAEAPPTVVRQDGATLTPGAAWSDLSGDRATYWVEGRHVWIRVPARAGPTEVVIEE
ncbi:MAG: glycoside hydrolase family 31 protein [Deltaproteobacteria bacterium]|nr:glycoside hydrolase family 31 protein [Deltaproteobacteria bacterium]